MQRVTKKQDEDKKKEITLDMLQPSRYKPNDLQQMADDTKFTKSESSIDLWLFVTSNLITMSGSKCKQGNSNFY